MSQVKDGRWWADEFKGERFKRILDLVEIIRNHQERWRKLDLLHACLYGNMEMLGFGPDTFWKFVEDDGRLVVNLIKPKVDTWVSMMCRSPIEAILLPSEQGTDARESWTVKKKCRGFERFCNGKLDEAKFHTDIEPLAVLDVGIFGHGLCKVYIKGVDDQAEDWSEADVAIERAYPHQMVINDAEAMEGNPQSIFQRKPVDRYVLMSKFPKLAKLIEECPKGFFPDEGGVNEMSADVICVTEAWHLPSKKGAKDGRHCLVIQNANLIDDQYDAMRFPFARLTQMPVPFGIRGIGIAQELRPIQISQNQMLTDFQDAAHTLARPKWLIPNQSGADKAHFDDQTGSQIWYDAPYKPEAWSPQTLPPDVYKMMLDHSAWADATVGISGGRSGGTVATNLKSGEAIERAADEQDGRFLISSKMREAFVMDVVDLLIDASMVIGKNRKDYASRFIDGKKSVMIDFGKYKLERDQFTIDHQPVSSLAYSPGARYDQIERWRQDGVIDMPTYRQLQDFPDTTGALRRLNAPQDLADMLIERYLMADDPGDKNVYIAPEGRWPIQILYEKFLYATVEAQLDGCPDENIELMNRFMDQLEDCARKQGMTLPGMPAPNQGAMNTAPALGVAGGSPAPVMPMPGAATPPMGGPPMPPGAPVAPPPGAS